MKTFRPSSMRCCPSCWYEDCFKPKALPVPDSTLRLCESVSGFSAPCGGSCCSLQMDAREKPRNPNQRNLWGSALGSQLLTPFASFKGYGYASSKWFRLAGQLSKWKYETFFAPGTSWNLRNYMLTLIDVSLQHSDGSSTRWSSICTCTCLRNFMEEWKLCPASAHNEITWWQCLRNHLRNHDWKINPGDGRSKLENPISNVLTWDSELPTWGPSSSEIQMTWDSNFRYGALLQVNNGMWNEPLAESWHCTVLCVNIGAQNEIKGFPYVRNSNSCRHKSSNAFRHRSI